MAGSIPPLVSSSPPPLCPFEDEDEEEDDEFGMYTTAEEIDYNDCISFKAKGCEKQDGEKSRGEHDSTSQDSATDSGLCPDSEGMSPTPHSDDERNVKQGISVSVKSANCDSECVNSTSVSQVPDKLPNGHVSTVDCEVDDFGSFKNVDFSSTDCVVTFGQGISETNNHLELDPTRISEIEKTNNAVFNCKETFVNLEIPSLPDDFSNQSIQSDSLREVSNVDIIELQNPVPTEESSSEITKIESLDFVHEQECHKEHTKEEITNIVEDSEQDIKLNVETAKSEQDSEDEFDDFTDFKANFSNNLDLPETEQSDEFSEHSKPSLSQGPTEEISKSVEALPQDVSDEEFANFADFSSDCAFVSAQSSNSLDNFPNIPLNSSDDTDLRTDSEFQDWVSVFPSSASPPPEGEEVSLLQPDDVIWTRLSPLESSPALSYLWADSLAYQQLLSALNIDSRNILWNNASMPRFAANLSCGPLQPTKAPEPLPPSTSTPNQQPATTQDSVPDAHFDWVSSGLINPLDSSHSSLLDLNFMVTLATHLSISPKPVLNVHKTLSAEAETILGSLPDLSFMRKTYIDFPVSEG